MAAASISPTTSPASPRFSAFRPAMPHEPLKLRIRRLPPSPNAGRARDRLGEMADRQGLGDRGSALLAEPQIADFLGSALGDSPFLLDLAAKDVRRLVDILNEAPEARIERQIAELSRDWPDRGAVQRGLRRAKQNVALTLGLADLAGAITLEAATGALSRFADAAVQSALRFAIGEARRKGDWRGGADARGFILLAMGKLGAHELNYSSDIDLIALYEAHPQDLRDGVEPAAFWVRIVRATVALLQERTADGYVFRTDLRLRPDAGATPVALSALGALSYYESMGQNWERAAFIKARACAGDIAAGERFLAELRPFIWRKHLDFAAIADIHSIKRQVHAHRGHARVRAHGHDIKRGRGGIREIELFVQTQQLIAGGRDPALRGRGTRPVLATLARKGWIDEQARTELDAPYQ
jgi:glutamate-ammonia-ligase adenylyltransferase